MREPSSGESNLVIGKAPCLYKNDLGEADLPLIALGGRLIEVIKLQPQTSVTLTWSAATTANASILTRRPTRRRRRLWLISPSRRRELWQVYRRHAKPSYWPRTYVVSLVQEFRANQDGLRGAPPHRLWRVHEISKRA